MFSGPCTPVGPRSPLGSDISGNTLPPRTSDDDVSTMSSGQGKKLVIPDSWPLLCNVSVGK